MNATSLQTDPRAEHNPVHAGSSANPLAMVDRRHDLDALRAIAMLLGVVLHAALSFAPIPWTVRDSRQSEFYSVLFACIHGFRMPLFFMLSGFFTAMLWRRRGLANLVRHRFRRIFLPLVIGCLTVVPAVWAVSSIASRPSPGGRQSSPLFAAVVSGELDVVRSELADPGSGVDALDPTSGSSPLCTAVFLGRTEATELLIAAQADVNLPNRDRATPLHIAVFMGRSQEAALLLKAGAAATARDAGGQTPADLLQMDFGTTNFIASSLGVPLQEREWRTGREKIAALLNATGDVEMAPSARSSTGFAALEPWLFQAPVFMHLWFLWFLCWLVAAFLVYAPISELLQFKSLPRWLTCSPLSLFWLIPLTMLPQSFMAATTFGPDSSLGLLPVPSVLGYYAVFFFFGALYWDMDDAAGRLGSCWFVALPVALLILFPCGLDLVSQTWGIVPRPPDESVNALAGGFLQAAFAWLMIFGSIGLCHRLLSHESPALRYVSDASYWLYLVHLPLVILAQWLVRDLPLPAWLKFAGIVASTTALLLVIYEYGVRYKRIGTLLNGPRCRPGRARPSVARCDNG